MDKPLVRFANVYSERQLKLYILTLINHHKEATYNRLYTPFRAHNVEHKKELSYTASLAEGLIIFFSIMLGWRKLWEQGHFAY